MSAPLSGKVHKRDKIIPAKSRVLEREQPLKSLSNRFCARTAKNWD